ncbi:MAG: hypothetical protein FWH12_05970 [Treponema sp.]|nr:hypothetical protein [Treponema sp.]
METTTSKGILFPDYAASLDPLEVDQGIQESINNAKIAILHVGISLVKIKNEKMYLPLGFKNMTAYMENRAKRSNMSRSSIFSWYRIGRLFLKFQDELEERGFCDHEGLSKLPYVEKALAHGAPDEVFDKLVSLSLRDFRDYARGGKARILEELPDLPPVSSGIPKEEVSAPGYSESVFQFKGRTWGYRGNKLFIMEKEVLTLNRKLPWRIENMIGLALRAACNALERKGYLLAVHLRSSTELDLITQQAPALREEVRASLSAAGS